MDKKFGFSKLNDLVKAGKIPDVEHISEDNAMLLGIPWEDKEYNYRINPGYDTQYITDNNKNTLGHFALDDDNVTKSVYISPENRGQGLGYKAHEALASKIPIQMDDANEPEIYNIWNKLKNNYPDKVQEIGTTHEGKPRYGFKKILESLGNGKFRSFLGPALGLGIGAAMMPDDASASDFIPGLDQAENAGDPLEDQMIMTEVKTKQNYEKSPAGQASKFAKIRKTLGK